MYPSPTLAAIGTISSVIFAFNNLKYRVELVVVLFGHILDLHNFAIIMKVLTAEEQAGVIARVGWLNLFNPCRAEGAYRLDLARWEERQVAISFNHSCNRHNLNNRSPKCSFI